MPYKTKIGLQPAIWFQCELIQGIYQIIWNYFQLKKLLQLYPSRQMYLQ
ncbi:unnamed protein product [Paramecium pentaurelia]|uniref:Uncharacterized protein n=1 Tax=Paramecium pentaurelia TaxID=43138 RepID=A0A8S1VST9_9CILI|nr:unnamed protein product [Paramecium pentaurelia]